MPRKTNKTTHVLNLLSGNKNQKSSKDDAGSNESNVPAEGDTSDSLPTQTPSSNITVDAPLQEDALSEVIHDQLLSLLEEHDDVSSEGIHEQLISLLEEHENKTSGNTPLPNAPSNEVVETQTDSVPTETCSEESCSEELPQAENNEPAHEEKSQPEFVVLNIVEQIVKDKIIYYMRQFDVCTCERCIADAVALTLNGLKPKYVVTSPEAVSPLLSFYGNKLISDITVEATKSCMVIKENPRHKKI